MHFPVSPRWLELALALWLVLSAFLWQHTGAQFANTWIVGALVALAAAGALRFDDLRYINVGLSIWLIASVWMLPLASESTLWNNLLVGLILFVSTLTPALRQPVKPGDSNARKRRSTSV